MCRLANYLMKDNLTISNVIKLWEQNTLNKRRDNEFHHTTGQHTKKLPYG